MSTNYGFEPTLDGLNNIDSTSTTSENIICQTLLATTSANTPTPAPSSNDTSVATTAFVKNAITGAGTGYVDLTTNQTVGGIKTFTSVPLCSTAPTTGSMLTNKTYVDSVSGTGLLSSNNIWTGDNNFSGSVCIFGAGGSATGVDGLNVSVGSVATSNLYLSATTIQTLNTTNFTINPAVLFNLIPTGTIMTSLASTMAGYLLCDGSSLSTSLQARLFAVIGYNYGGSGASFNLPDFRGAFLRGSGSQTISGTTYTGGAISSAGRQQDAVQTPLYASNEGFRSCAAGARDCVARDIIGTDPVDTNTGILPRFNRTATENRPFNYSVNYFIRY